MSDYTKVYNGGQKDIDRDPVSGADFDSEFIRIQVSDNSKVDKESTQTITGIKTMSSPKLNTPEINENVSLNATSTELNVLDGGAPTFPFDIDANDSIIMEDNGTTKKNDVGSLDTYLSATTKTLTNKTLTSPKINGIVTLNATSTELNQLDGVSVGGNTAGDILTTNNTQTLTNKTLTSPKINQDVTMSATSTELNRLDGVANGTALANKAVCVNGSKSVSGLGTVTATSFSGALSGNASSSSYCSGNTAGSAATITGNLAGDVTSSGMSTTITNATVMAKIAGTSNAGVVGSYAFLVRITGAGTATGATALGSTLAYSSTVAGGATPSGTWRCMGHSPSNLARTLWLRVS